MNIKDIGMKLLTVLLYILYLILALVGICLVGQLSKDYGTHLLIPFLLYVLILWLGYNLPKWYLRKWKISRLIIDIVAWANLAVPFIFLLVSPFIGLFIPAFTYSLFKNADEVKGQNKYLILALIGFAFAIVMVIWFIKLALK